MQRTTDQGPVLTLEPRAIDPRMLRRLGGVAAIAVASILVLGIVALVLGLSGLTLRTWLVVLFQIDAGIGALPPDPLRASNALDIVVLGLTGVSILGVWSLIPRPSRSWRAISVGLPFVGIILLFATGLVGRSAVMGAGFVVATSMTRTEGMKPLGYLGLSANALLFAGDLATGDGQAPFAAALVGLGYILLLAWFTALAARLVRSVS